jgi:transcriptional regulator with XRE-family HTH domain
LTTIEKILKLLSDNHITAAKITKDLELPYSAITEWKKLKAKPSTDAIVKIANYFNVSIDYLLGIIDNPRPPRETNQAMQHLTPEELELLSKFRVMNKNERVRASEYMNFLQSRTEFAEDFSTALDTFGQKPLTGQ